MSEERNKSQSNWQTIATIVSVLAAAVTLGGWAASITSDVAALKRDKVEFIVCTQRVSLKDNKGSDYKFAFNASDCNPKFPDPSFYVGVVTSIDVCSGMDNFEVFPFPQPRVEVRGLKHSNCDKPSSATVMYLKLPK